jgi:hypothetical protein
MPLLILLKKKGHGVPCPPHSTFNVISSSIPKAKAVEIGSALGMAEAMPLQSKFNNRFLGRAKDALGRNDKP